MRKGSQSTRILERLQIGSATPLQLAMISVQYNARIHELRRKGYRIECQELGQCDGIRRTLYRLKGE